MGKNSSRRQSVVSHVFVSYAHADRERVRRYVERLKSSGFIVRWDDDLRGQPFDKQLKQWIEEADAIVIFWSLTSIKRNFVQSELHHANISKVISVRIDPIDPKSIPLESNILNIIDLSTSGESGISDGILKLVARCAELIKENCAPPPQDAETNSEDRAREPPQPAGSPLISVGANVGVVAHTIVGPVRTGG